VKRAAFAAQIAAIAPHKLVFLDECGFGLNLHRLYGWLYGWVVGGGRCFEEVPFTRGAFHQRPEPLGAGRVLVANSSLCQRDARRANGMRALWQKKEAWNRDTFEAFLCDGLLPVLERGSVIVLDNARFHHGGQIQALVEKAGCSLLYLPPYSPDLNPIELAWSYLKNLVRSWAPREDDARQRDIQCAATLLPPQAATNWFRKCGIQLPD
jgi:transposase